ncbi:hypothetical protein BOTBODRAFT_37761 [Botryobasidium botryosum FD-172 SS1]|uniref:C2 domain-containing protein n=1 Tax=Botryobasidium botryosum (strain FD-172 SS1) TaxID=930990 RepID=A0A067LYV5_BOTB1|nr:hypothetical protein BOTBODRAFT_37761 [Botryobasidium botryosum FD-172 SS1]
MAYPSKNTNSDAARSDAAEALKLTVLSGSSLPRISAFYRYPRALVTLRILDQVWNTNVSERSKDPRWGDEFSLRGEMHSTLKVELKVSRRFARPRKEDLIGTAEVRFEELQAKQIQAYEENIDFVVFDLPLASPGAPGPQPSISIRVHKPTPALAVARERASSARDDYQRMRMGPALLSVPAGTSGVASSAQDAVQAIGSAKEIRALYKTTLETVKVFVKMVDAFAEIHPYAKAAWAVLSAGYKAAAAQKDRDDALCELLESMSTALDIVCRFDKTALHEEDKRVILRVAKKTNECALFIKKYCSTEGFAFRAAKGVFSNESDEIARFKSDFDLLRKNMDTGAILSLTEGLSEVNKDLYKIGENVKDIARNVEHTVLTVDRTALTVDRTALTIDRAAQVAILDKLPYAAGASWDPESGCLSDTREVLVEEIMGWIKGASASGGAEILCLTGVAGSGKTAIAHTVAQRCHQEGILDSSFFFSREFEERSRPDKLLSTIARDLARYPDICSQLSSTLEADQSLATASLSRQFTPLIVEPCRRHTFDNSIVFVLDALDEVNDPPDVLKILRNDFPKLPQAFRLFTTSRDIPDIDIYLSRSAHVRMRTIDLDAGMNLGDLCTYIHWRFGEVAEKLGLGPSWPGKALKDMFISRAQGLFQWAVAVFQALECAYDPTAVLEALLADLQTGLSPEAKMDEIYSKILQAYSWRDPGFKRDYDLVVGAILAAKSPLSVSALQTMHPGIPNISKLLSRLGALLTGWRYPSQRVQILHLSLRDFLTARASDSAPFYVHEKDHNQRLGLFCLAFLNENLKPDTPGVGYLESDLPGIPTISKNQVSEELWYACEFWTAHVAEFEAPAPIELVERLQTFLSVRLISWLEVSTSVDTFKGFQHVRTWMQSIFPEYTNLMNNKFNSRLASTLSDISDRMSYMDRREEALLAIQEAVELRRLIEGEPTSLMSDLSSSLHNLSIRLSNVGRREDALAAIQESVGLRRQLAERRPAEFNPELAASLNSLSIDLSSLGHREDALAAIREAVGLYRQLARDRPMGFNSNLAMSLSTLSNRLSDLGQREDALAAIREAVDLYWQLTRDHPTTFTPDLAMSFNNLSSCLSDLGQHEDALAAIRVAVGLYRQVTQHRPTTFNPNLALSLNTLSSCLSDLGRREDALAAVREATGLYRQLARDRPTAFNPNLAASLSNLSNRLSDLGQQEDALVVIREAVDLRRQLSRDRPITFNPDLATSLNTLSICLSDLGQQESALTTIQEAVQLYRQLARDRPTTFNPDFATSLNTLSNCLSGLGQWDDALAAIREAVGLYRQLARDLPTTFNPDLAMSLNTLSRCLLGLGQWEDALAAIQEAVKLYRQLAQDRPTAFNLNLALSLYHLSIDLSALDRREEALEAAKEAVKLYWPLAKERPAVYKSSLVDALRLLLDLLRDLGQLEEEDAIAAGQALDALDSFKASSDT